MAPTIGVNLRVTGHCNQGGRKHMEDMFSVAYQQTEDEKDLEYAYFGIFDGHGGREAASFAKEHLMDSIVSQKKFWSDDDEDVLKAIRDGFIATHYAMWRELEKWPKTLSGLPSTSGTTASIAFIRKGKIYIGHVGDSSVVIGYQNKGESEWKAKSLTRDHKPESEDETDRIRQCGGKVLYKSGVPRVVWNRPRIGHKGPVRRSTHIDEIPFLAVARSLGDLWSYNSTLNQFVVSPEPDVEVIPIDISRHRCLILGTDGLWNMLSPQSAVDVVHTTEYHNVRYAVSSSHNLNWINPSKRLVDTALAKWSCSKLIADNTSVVTLMLDPPGPPIAQVLRKQHVSQSHNIQEQPQPGAVPVSSPQNHISSQVIDGSIRAVTSETVSIEEENTNGSAYSSNASTGGVVIFTRYPTPHQQPLEPIKKSERAASNAQSLHLERLSRDSSPPAMEGSGRVCEVANILHDPHCSRKHEPPPCKKMKDAPQEKKSEEEKGDNPPPVDTCENNPEIQSNEVSSSLCGSEVLVEAVKEMECKTLCNKSTHSMEVSEKHKGCWLLRRRTRSEERYQSLMKKSETISVLSEYVPWSTATSQKQVVNGVRRRLLSTGDLGKVGGLSSKFASLSNSQRCCRQHLGHSISKGDRRRTVITPRRGRSRPLDSCTVAAQSVRHGLQEVILNKPVMDPSTSSEMSSMTKDEISSSRLSTLMKSCCVVLQRQPQLSTLISIRRQSRKKRNSISIRQNAISKSASRPQVHCNSVGGIGAWVDNSCTQQGSMVTRSRKKDEA
ncbi:hypothetical protein J437_LFUL017164 [Ladona fulva]|uniref:PPM-type phosphatase domain-containing protein n=1 Tax=Ladona fulva TaxID=123851 RepID=A0A8K0P9V7_LADFU|nr:hypothetical protein J437_LFUL017164 [Ladona fulva]